VTSIKIKVGIMFFLIFQSYLLLCLQELCLHTKLLAPVNCTIADFLMKAPEPPPALIVRNAVQMLKVGVFFPFISMNIHNFLTRFQQIDSKNIYKY
jgi:hypothetical protein